MRPFPGAIGRFGMHGARILPSRSPFRVEGPEIIHDAKMLPPLPDLSRHRGAGCGHANWPNGLCALQPGHGPLAACAGLCHLVRPAATRARRAHHPPLPFARPRRTHRCRYSRGRIHRRRPSRRARRAHYAASLATPHVTLFIVVGGGEPPIGRFPRCPAALALPMPPRTHRASCWPTRRPLPAPRGLRRGSRNSREIVR